MNFRKNTFLVFRFISNYDSHASIKVSNYEALFFEFFIFRIVYFI